MRYYQLADADTRRLAVDDGSATRDLTAAKPRLQTFGDLARAADLADATPDELATRHLDAAAELDAFEDSVRVPVDAAEIWAAGVTYSISEKAREAESDTPDAYLDVYDAERPEVFFKATPGRTVGPGDAVGIREDSEWNVPEPELGVVLYDGDIAGYTVGNDVSSRSIEGENPLYLPQAKVYDKCCSIGPCVVTPSEIDDPHDLALSMSVWRDGAEIYDDRTSTGEMVRTCEELVSYYTRHNAVPELSVLLTGTSLVPENDFTLRAGDEVRIEIEDVGSLSNVVEVV